MRTLVDIRSSNIKQVGYLHKERELLLIFRNAPTVIYVFGNVPKLQHTRLMDATSKGTYFTKYIKTRFQFEKKNLDYVKQ